MTQVAQLSLQIAVNIAVPYWIVRRDLRRLNREQLARSWNDATIWSAVVVFGPLCLPVHFARSRRSVFGLCLGLLATAAALLISMLLGYLSEVVLELVSSGVR
jgi:hypothetical protein